MSFNEIMGGASLDVGDVSGPVQRKQQAFLTVNDRMNFLEDIASTALVDTQGFIEDLQDLISSLIVPTVDDLNIESVTIPNVDYSDRPDLGTLSLDLSMPDAPPDILFKEVPDLIDGVDINMPSFGGIEPPVFEAPTKPEMTELGDIPSAPNIADVEIPNAPSITLPDAPVLWDIALPEAPEIAVPTFDHTFIEENLTLPGGFEWGQPEYTSDIWSDLLAKVLDGIKNGGTGLALDVEEAIYWQHLNRTMQENDKLYSGVENYFAGRGFTLPSGMMASKLSQTASEILRANLNASKEIMVNQAELAQKNTQFLIEKGVALEGMLRDFFIKETNLSFEAQKVVAGQTMEIFKAALDKQNFSLERYKTEAAVWETRVKAMMTHIEIFKAQVEAARVTAETQKLLVDIYNSKIAATDSLVKLYLGQMEGAKIHSEIQQVYLGLYESKLKGYLAVVDLNKSRIMQYEAELSGEKTKADIYVARMSAISAEVEAKSKILDTLIARMNIRIEENKAIAEQYDSNIKKYSAEIDGRSKAIGAQVDGFKASAAAYEAETDRDKSVYQAKMAEIQLRVSEAEFRLHKAVAQIDASLKGYQAIKELQITGTSGIMQVGAQLAASAMQGVGTNASISYSGADSYNASDSSSFSKTISESKTVVTDI